MAFERKFDFIDELKNEPLFKNKLLPDILIGDVFPAIRKNEIHFYYKGGRLFKYNGKDFYTHIKYGFICREEDRTDIKETELNTLKPIDKFEKGYDRIKASCEIYSAKSEACNVAKLFKNYSYVISKENKILLDIEAAMDSESEDKNIDRFDLVLFDKEKATLQIVEAKLFSNNEIRAKEKYVLPVVEQIKRYEKNIEHHKKNAIIPAYQNYVKIVNELFNLNLPKHLPEPQSINDKVNLLIFDFDDKQKEKLKKEVKVIKENLNINNKVYVRGNMGTDKDKTILKQLFNK